MDKYEISLWEDYSDQTSSGIQFLNERKIAVIGSDTMEAQARAIEPNLVEEINGTHTFTFKMYYTYTDNQTGEKYDNPFGKYLINERKVKVLWKKQWYDFVIKKCQEDTFKKSVTYTCTDLFINELSKQGYSLEFSTELQNNTGTAAELATSVLKGSTWQYDMRSSTPIVQKTEGPVYEIVTTKNFSAIKQNPLGDTTINIPAGKTILIFYDSIVSVLESGGNNVPVQFLYSSTGYITDTNDMLVINGDCCSVTLNLVRNNSYLQGVSPVYGQIFSINLNGGISENYRAKRLVKIQKSEYDPLLERYVLLCKDKNNNEIYEVATTEYSNPLTVTNLIANPTEFTSVSGWIGSVKEFGVYPKFGSTTNISTYNAKSYLKITSGNIYNTGIQSNINYFKPTDTEIKQGKIGGIQKGEKYIYRVKAKTNSNNIPNSYITNTNAIVGNLYKYNASYSPIGNAVFTQQSVTKSNNWIEYTLICNIAIPAENIDQYGLFLKSNSTYWLEDVQFFKYEEGIKSYSKSAQPQRMDPGDIALQSIVKPVYKYYFKNNNATSADELTYLYIGETESSAYTPVYNNYEKIGTITEKESNRFNILQSIAETFQAWVKFRIDHENNGAIKFINGVPQKFVYFVEEIGQETGISFEYGIDLKTISRTINSDKITTKIIVNPNSNEFGKNGFCAIARSDQNYTKENFILNLDYYTQQNLLDKTTLNKDLYSTQSNYIGYYYYLHAYNKEYDDLSSELVTKELDLTKQKAQQEVYEQYLLAAHQQLEIIQSDIITLAGVSAWADAQTYARTHASNDKVQSLLNAYGEAKNEISKYQTYLNNINSSITLLESYITTIKNRQSALLNLLETKHKVFNNKYSTFLMEGTWQDENYINDDEYYLDGLKVAYTSSRPQLSYTINVLRLSSLEEYSSKIFNLGDICYIQDKEFFGYLSDGITPYKEKILVSKISSFFDQPEKDVLTIQNYKTRFDDLFQRIAATTQSLSYSEGAFTRAAETFNTDGTIKFPALQDTFDQNAELVLNSSNQDVIWDNTGITVKNKFNSADQTKIIAGGIFVTNDGGQTWKNAIRGDGISTELLTAGRVNTSEIYIYDGSAPSFRWDSDGLTAYSYTGSTTDFGKFVRHDKYGFYGYEGKNDFIPTSEAAIWSNAKFGMTWKGFFLKGGSATGSHFEISDSGTGINFTLANGDGSSGLYIQATNNGVNFSLRGSKDGNGLDIISNATGTNFSLKGNKNGSGLEIISNAKTTSFKMINNNTSGGIEISTINDIIITDSKKYKRVQIGRLNGNNSNYGLQLRDNDNNIVFNVDSSGASIAGWVINNNSIYKKIGNDTIGLFSSGTQATINGHTDTYYIIAGNQFGITHDGKIYSSSGEIGGWKIESGRLSSSVGNAYTYIRADGTLEGRTVNGSSWSIQRDGHFHFNDSASGNEVTSQIVLGPTTINNTAIYTQNINAGGGSIGGCTISSGGISGGGWRLGPNGASIPITSLTAGGATLNAVWQSITYVSSLANLTLHTEIFNIPRKMSVYIDGQNIPVTITEYNSPRLCTGWGGNAVYNTKTGTFLRGTLSDGSGRIG